MNLTTMVYVSEMKRSVAFYETLGLVRDGQEADEPNQDLNEFAIGDGTLALHRHRDGPLPDVGGRADMILTVPADGSLDRVYRACLDRGFENGGEIADIGFERFFWVRDPDGFPVTINERAA